jgi:5-methylcytosine-specific restriction endonuclease McrA
MTSSNRNARNQSKGCWIRKERRLAIYLRDNFTCCYCNKDLRNVSASDITLDHLIPRSSNGTNDSTNLVTACKICNSTRQDKPYYQYATAESLRYIDQQRIAPLNIELAKNIIRGYIVIE